MTVAEEYAKLLSTYNRVWGQVGKTISGTEWDRARYVPVKTPTRSAIHRLEREIEEVREAGQTVRFLEKQEHKRAYWVDRYHTIRAILEEIDAGNMSPAMPFYNPAHARGIGSGRRQVEANVGQVTMLIDRALTMYQSEGDSLEQAQERVAKAISSIWSDTELEYQLERFIYGVYDRQYAKWGWREYKAKLDKIAQALGV